MVSRGLKALKAGTKRGDNSAMPLKPAACRAPAELERPCRDGKLRETTWMSRWKLGSMVIGSVGYFTPRNTPFIRYLQPFWVTLYLEDHPT